MIWSFQRSGRRPLGRRHDEGGVEDVDSLGAGLQTVYVYEARHLGAVYELFSLVVVVRCAKLFFQRVLSRSLSSY